MQKVLIIGYGNADREDDGVAWHVLHALSTHYHSPIIESDGGIFEAEHNPHLIFSLQLTPEMSEALTQYEQVCFIDAHTGAYAEEVRAEIITPNFQASPSNPGKLFKPGSKSVWLCPPSHDGFSAGLSIWLLYRTVAPNRQVGSPSRRKNHRVAVVSNKTAVALIFFG
jgi:hypothetical protein